MTYKRRALGVLSRTELLEVGRELEVGVSSGMRLDELLDVVAGSKRARLDRVLRHYLLVIENDRRRSDRRRQDYVRARVPASGGELPDLRERGPDRGWTVAPGTNPGRGPVGATDAQADRRARRARRQLRVRNDAGGSELPISRVAQRVRQGGHDVPEEVIRRRFVAGKENLELLYKPIVDKWRIYDNLGPEPLLLETGDNP